MAKASSKQEKVDGAKAVDPVVVNLAKALVKTISMVRTMPYATIKANLALVEESLGRPIAPEAMNKYLPFLAHVGTHYHVCPACKGSGQYVFNGGDRLTGKCFNCQSGPCPGLMGPDDIARVSQRIRAKNPNPGMLPEGIEVKESAASTKSDEDVF